MNLESGNYWQIDGAGGVFPERVCPKRKESSMEAEWREESQKSKKE